MSIIIKREEASYVLIVRLPKLGVNLEGMLRVASQQVLGVWLKTGHAAYLGTNVVTLGCFS